MKKILLLSITLFLLCSCTPKETVTEVLNENIVKPDFVKEELDAKFGTDEIYIVKTYLESPVDEFQKYLDENRIFTTVKHYQLSDGSWQTENHTYKFKLELKGRLNNAARDSVYVLLTNNPDITFDMAWKASGLSSNMDDYFSEEEAIIVALG